MDGIKSNLIVHHSIISNLLGYHSISRLKKKGKYVCECHHSRLNNS